LKIEIGDDLLKEIAKKAVEEWGAEVQTKMAIEEMAELIVALNHYDRGRITLEEVASEIADVKIMMEQLEYIIDKKAEKELVREQEEYKKSRLAKMLE
jgi:hypothetical protein